MNEENEVLKVSSLCPMAKRTSSSKSECKCEKGKTTYASYLYLDKLLSSQNLIECGKYTHDQHLFQVTHQVYELWFKQMIFEIDSINDMFRQKIMDERNMRVIINRLNRVVLILKALVDQFCILETMTANDFLDFRDHLQAASGFQSLQFRLLENKIGIAEESRVKYNKKHYKSVFDNDSKSKDLINKSLLEDSLRVLLERWLERTPGCNDEDSQFWSRYCEAVDRYIKDYYEDPLSKMEDGPEKSLLEEDYKKEKKSFETIMNEETYNSLLKRGEKVFSHKAFKGAMMIALYRDETRFSQPYQMISLILDVDANLTKWRYNHVVMVQRMIGSKLGTGGSSGYQYLRSTISDRYMPFCDLCNLATYLIPSEYIPPLSPAMRRKLIEVDNQDQLELRK